VPGLYLHCAICSRKQADGLISGAAWARLELPADAHTDGASPGSVVRVCPSCLGMYPSDWQSKALSGLRQAS
jgi:hypothetical protein